ncbi:hypothetical protein T439DRAFT_384570 [Meredithblackwellia eburnea MCA 4105]
MANPIPSTSQLVEKVPLIKSPSFWVPPPVELPPDIHPLPDDLTAYFVYPHTLESHALATLPHALDSLSSLHSQRVHLLASLAESRERARRAHLNKLAPGWGEGGGGIMQPVRRETGVVGGGAGGGERGGGKKDKGVRDLMDSDREEEEEGESHVGTEKRNRDSDLLGEGGGGTCPPTTTGTDKATDAFEREQMQALVDGLAAMDARNTTLGRVGDLL